MLSTMECEMGSLQSDPPPRAVFVSFAEADREFAERLRADMDLSPFLDTNTNPTECELAVAVVSEEYLTGSTAAQLRGCEVLPLFWGLSREEFHDPQRRARWFRDGGFRDVLRDLDGRRGVEYVKALGEAHCRQEVVAVVCTRLHLNEEIDVEKALQRPRERMKSWCYYFRLVLVIPVVIISIICVGSALYSAFFCEQGYPSPYAIIFPTMT